jgi:hypothetical protein
MRTEFDTAERPPERRSRGTATRRGRSRRSGMAGRRHRARCLAPSGRRRPCLIGDVAQYVAVLVLSPRRAEVSPDAPVEELHLVRGVGGAVDAAEADEAAAVDEVVLDPGEASGECRQRKVVLGESSTSSECCRAWRSDASSSVSCASVNRSVQSSSSATSSRVHSQWASRMRGSFIGWPPWGRGSGDREGRRSVCCR